MKKGLLLLLALTLQMLPGGASFDNLFGRGRTAGPAIMGGTRQNALMFDLTGCAAFDSLFALIDCPFSFVMDLLLLPVTIPWDLLTGGPRELKLRY